MKKWGPSLMPFLFSSLASRKQELITTPSVDNRLPFLPTGYFCWSQPPLQTRNPYTKPKNDRSDCQFLNQICSASDRSTLQSLLCRRNRTKKGILPRFYFVGHNATVFYVPYFAASRQQLRFRVGSWLGEIGSPACKQCAITESAWPSWLRTHAVMICQLKPLQKSRISNRYADLSVNCDDFVDSVIINNRSIAGVLATCEARNGRENT